MSGGEDLSAQCLRDMQEKFKEFQVRDLRDTFCAVCRNSQCGFAKLSANPWEDRMSTQVERLLENPRYADPLDPQWSRFKEMDFPSLFRESIRLHLAEKRGDWSIPSTREVDLAMGTVPTTPAEKPNPEVEKAVEALRKQHTIVRVHSKTQPGILYEVTLDTEGTAISCNCAAGVRGRRCTHRIWAESQFNRELPLESPSLPPQQPHAALEAPLPLLGVRVPAKGPLEGLQEPFQGLPRNTPLSPGILLDGPPADGLRSVVKDSWAAPSNKPKVTPSGVQITIGKKDE